MTLPIRQLPTDEFMFKDGVKLHIRGLSRGEAIQIRALGDDVAAVEVFCIKCATNTPESTAKAWHENTPQNEVEDLVNAIARLSGLDPDEGKDDAEVLPSANLTELITYLQRISEGLSQRYENSQAPR